MTDRSDIDIRIPWLNNKCRICNSELGDEYVIVTELNDEGHNRLTICNTCYHKMLEAVI